MERLNNLASIFQHVATCTQESTVANRLFDTMAAELNRIGVDCAVAVLDSQEREAYLHYVSFRADLREWLEKQLGYELDGLPAPHTCLRPWRAVVELQDAVFREPADLVADVLLAVPDMTSLRALQLLIEMVGIRAAYLPLVAEEEVHGALILWGANLRREEMPAYAVLATQIAGYLHRQHAGSSDHCTTECVAHYESRWRYQSLFAHVPIALYRSTPDGTIVDANPAMVEMLGYPDHETLLATNARDLYVDAHVRHRWRANLANVGVVRNFEMQLRCFDGSTIWVQSSARAVTDGGVQYYEGALKDITTEKQDEQIFRSLAAGVASETGTQFFESLVVHLSESLGVECAFVGKLVANKTRIRTAAVFIEGRLQHNFEFDIVDTPCQVLIDGEDDVMCVPEGVYEEFPGTNVLGQTESYVGATLEDSAGAPLGVLVVCSSRRLTRPERTRSILQVFAHRAAAEFERLRSEAEVNKLSQVVEQTADIVYITDPEGIFEYVNPAFEEITGFSREDVCGKTPRMLKSGIHEQSFYEELWKTIKAGNVFRGIVANRKKNGEIYYEEKTITPRTDEHGNITNFITTGKDITERRRAQKAQARAHRAARRRLERLETLYAVAQSVIGVHDLSELLETGLERILDLLPADAGSVYLHDACDDDTLSLFVHRGFSEDNVQHFSTHRVGGTTITGSVAFTGEPLLIEETTSFPYKVDDRAVVEKESIQSHAAIPLRTDERVIGVLNLVWHSRRSLDSETLDLLEGVADVFASGVINARLYQAEQTRRRELSALYTLSRELSVADSVTKVAETAARHIVETVEVTFCRVMLEDESGAFTCRAVHTAHPVERPLCPDEAEPSAIQTFYRHIIEDRNPVVFRRSERSMPETVQRRLPFGVATVLCLVPLIAGNDALGVLCVGEARNEDRSSFDSAKRRLITSIADLVAITVENIRLFEAVKDQREHLRALAAKLTEVEEAERQRLSRELHDQVGQTLSALNLSLNLIRTQLPAEAGDALRHRLEDALQLVEQTIERSRNVMAELRPPVLDDYGLVAALRWYGEQFTVRTNINVLVKGNDLSPRLDSTVAIMLFRVAQEALSNVAKHAQATTAQVGVESCAGKVRLDVIDDGVGFDPERRALGTRQGWGLSTMAERAESVGGSFRIESERGDGTRVIVEVPQ